MRFEGSASKSGTAATLARREIGESPQIQLKHLENRVHRIAPGTHAHAPPTLPVDDGLHALGAEAADAVRARVRILESVQPPTAGTIDLHGAVLLLRRIRRGRVSGVEEW